MDKKTESKTEKDSFWEERIVDAHHYRTTISDGQRSVEGLGNTPEQAEKNASEKWDTFDDDDE